MQNCSKLLCSKYSANIFVTQCVSEQSGLLQDHFWGDVSFQNVHYFFFVSLEKMLSNQPTGFFPPKTIKQKHFLYKHVLYKNLEILMFFCYYCDTDQSQRCPGRRWSWRRSRRGSTGWLWSPRGQTDGCTRPLPKRPGRCWPARLWVALWERHKDNRFK